MLLWEGACKVLRERCINGTGIKSSVIKLCSRQCVYLEYLMVLRGIAVV